MPTCPPGYHSRWRRNNKEKWNRTKRAYQGRLRQVATDAKSKPCKDCGTQYPPYVMQFDHVRGEKFFDVAMAAGRLRVGYEKLKAEIAKCDVVCANCHAVRTHNRRLLKRRDIAQVVRAPS